MTTPSYMKRVAHTRLTPPVAANKVCLSTIIPHPTSFAIPTASQSVPPTSVTRLEVALPAFEDVLRQHVVALLALVRASDPAPLVVLALVVLTEMLNCFRDGALPEDLCGSRGGGQQCCRCWCCVG